MGLREHNSGQLAVHILVGMTISTPVLARIASRWEPEMFGKARKAVNRIGQWCVDHYLRHGKAPDLNSLDGQCSAWGSEQADEATVGDVEKHLAQIRELVDRRHGDVNCDGLADQAAEFFNAARVRDLMDVANAHLENGKSSLALEALAKFHRVEMGTSEYIDVDTDRTASLRMFEDRQGGLFRYGSGAIAQFFGDHLEREGFLAFMGKEKVGKTFWLVDLAHEARKHRLRTFFFGVGDMGPVAIHKRFTLRKARKPWKAGTVRWPLSIKRQEGEPFAVPELEDRVFEEGLSMDDVDQDNRRLSRLHTHSLDSYLRFKFYANTTATVKMLDAELQDHARNGWEADVVVIDYADILAPPKGVQDARDQINTNWKQLRALSQERHCLVVTATQADAKSYDQNNLRRRNFSDDKRKYGHVTGMISINQSDDEKRVGVQRLGWLLLREGEFHEDRFVHCAGCLALGKPRVRSCW